MTVATSGFMQRTQNILFVKIQRKFNTVCIEEILTRFNKHISVLLMKCKICQLVHSHM